MKKVIVTNDYVEKYFQNKEKYDNELFYREEFKDNFIIPRIFSYDENKLMMRFEKIDGCFLDTIINEMNFNEVINLFNTLPKKEGRINETEKILFIKSKIRDVPEFILESVNKNDGFLVHGDFRPQNIFKKDERYGLIDFENSSYAFQEKDFAYFYMELIYFNNQLSNEILNYLRNEKNYNRFLFYCLSYTLSSMQNPLSNKKGLESVLGEILGEIKNLKIDKL